MSMILPLISKQARELGASPTVAGILGTNIFYFDLDSLILRIRIRMTTEIKALNRASVSLFWHNFYLFADSSVKHSTGMPKLLWSYLLTGSVYGGLQLFSSPLVVSLASLKYEHFSLAESDLSSNISSGPSVVHQLWWPSG